MEGKEVNSGHRKLINWSTDDSQTAENTHRMMNKEGIFCLKTQGQL